MIGRMKTPPRQHALRKGRVSLPGQVYLITTVTRHRAPVFEDLFAGRGLVRQLYRLQQLEQADTLSYVVMPDHLHWLCQLRAVSLERVVKRLKGSSSRTVPALTWQPGFHDQAVRNPHQLKARARYMIANPLRAGLVDRIGAYPLWDAVWLKGDTEADWGWGG